MDVVAATPTLSDATPQERSPGQSAGRRSVPGALGGVTSQPSVAAVSAGARRDVPDCVVCLDLEVRARAAGKAREGEAR